MKQEHLAADVVVLAYDYVHTHDVLDARLCGKYKLRPNTLSDIKAGKVLVRGRDKYMHAFVCELVRLRKIAKLNRDEAKITEITQQMANLVVLEHCPEAKNTILYR